MQNMTNMDLKCIIYSVVLCLYLRAVTSTSRPNIVLIIADDMGWNDVSYHGSRQFYTPNIDLLAYTGVPLQRYYTHCQCTPSRAAMLTGKFAHKTGMQGFPLTNAEDRAIPLTEKLLPEYLKELGYSTHLIGKWHLGRTREAYLPTRRGYDSHFGHRGGFIDYYDYTLEEPWTIGKVSGLDMFKNLTAAWDVKGYITDVYNEEAIRLIKNHIPNNPLFLTLAHNAPHAGNEGSLLQAPEDEIRAMRQVESLGRRAYAAMMKKLDDSIGDVLAALEEKGILDNTIIIFVSDNGGATQGNPKNWASNWPLRGNKMTPWEGGVRVPGLVWSTNMTKERHSYEGYMHSVDWLPTLLSAVGVDVPENIDGLDMWEAITKNKDSLRNIIYEIDSYSDYAAIISGDYKFVRGKVNEDKSAHLGSDLKGMTRSPPNYKEALKNSKVYTTLVKAGLTEVVDNLNIDESTAVICAQNSNAKCFSESDTWCLFNIKEDPCEEMDLSTDHSDLAVELNTMLNLEMKNVMPRKYPLYRDPRGLPKLFNFTWAVFLADDEL